MEQLSIYKRARSLIDDYDPALNGPDPLTPERLLDVARILRNVFKKRHHYIDPERRALCVEAGGMAKVAKAAAWLLANREVSL